MADYFDLVSVKHDPKASKVYLFRAPAWSGLKNGDEVLCVTQHGDEKGYVFGDPISVTQDDEKFAFMLHFLGHVGDVSMYDVAPIKAVIKQSMLYYKDEATRDLVNAKDDEEEDE